MSESIAVITLPKERKTELWFSIWVAAALLVAGCVLLVVGVFDTPEGGTNAGAVQVFTSLSWTLTTLAVGYVGGRTARKFSSDKTAGSEVKLPVGSRV